MHGLSLQCTEENKSLLIIKIATTISSLHACNMNISADVLIFTEASILKHIDYTYVYKQETFTLIT